MIKNGDRGIFSSVSSIFKIPVLRNIFIAAVFGFILLPLVIRIFIYPMYSNYIVSLAEDDGVLLARHLLLSLDLTSDKLDRESITSEIKNDTEDIISTLSLTKFKIFSSEGEVLYSSEKADIGIFNTNGYFQNIVASGQTYTKVVEKDAKTAEGRIAKADVVETYVPIVSSDGDFLGAFEIYFDITSRWTRLKTIVGNSTLIILIIVVILFCVTMITLIHAAAMFDEREKSRVRMQLAADIMQNADEGIVVTGPDNRITTVNPAFSRVTGYAENEVIGQNPSILQSGRQSREFFKDMWESIKVKNFWQGEIWNRRKDGEIYPEWLTIMVIRDSKKTIVHHVGMFLDISHFKYREKQLESLAYLDALTELPNRVLLQDRLEQNLAAAKRNTEKAAALFLDLDGFKKINDTLGHNAGDEILQIVAKRFLGCIREEDTIGRIGGDEFIVSPRRIKKVEEIAHLAERLIDCIKTPRIEINGAPVDLGVSIGISIFPDNGEDAAALILAADTAMYAAKKRGRNCYVFFDNTNS